MPKWLSPGAKDLIQRILDPNPVTRITVAGIKADEWFKQNYSPEVPDEEEILVFDEKSLVNETL